MENDPTNTNLAPTNPAEEFSFRPNDIGFRLVLVPAFGIAVPLITGMINPDNFNHWEVKLSFLYTILIAFLVWQGNRYLHFSLRSYFNWHKRPGRKIAVLLFTIIFYTIPVSVILLVGWYKIFENGQVDWNVIFTSSLIIMICVIFITHVYETVFLVKESETEMIKNSKLERAKLEAELEALKNQIDPHFIFNSLNTLSHLIEERPIKAKLFNDNLADVYRYILQNKSRDLVILGEEIAFLTDYFFLLKIRFENAVQIKLDIPAAAYDQYVIPPISLQILAENAIKHNEFTDRDPLTLELVLVEGAIIATNNLRKKTKTKVSSKIGLNNLNERYRLTANRGIEIKETETSFSVSLPILKIS